MSIRKLLLCGALSLVPMIAGASDALIKPLPTPDMSKLPPAEAAQLRAARTDFDKARSARVGPPLAESYADIAALYARAGLKDVAAIALYDASLIDPEDSRWMYLRGVIARDLKQNAEAREYFQAAMALDKAYLPIAYRLSATLVELGDLDGAHQLLERITREHVEHAVGFSMLAHVELRQKRFAAAVENFNHALKLEPQASQLYQFLSEAYSGLGNASAAKEAAAKTGNIPPKLDDPLVANFYSSDDAAAPSGPPLLQAQQLAASGSIAAARERLAEILRGNPDDVEALAFQARLEASVGDNTTAQTAAERALSLKPDSAAALFARGIVYEYAGDDNQAYSFYQRAVRADLKLPMARLLLGNAEMRRSQFTQAAEQYRQLATLQPDDSSALAHLAAALVAGGQCGRALAETSAAQALKSTDGDLMQIFVRLASTCAAAKQQERDMALDYAQALYKQRPDADDTAALALAVAARGKFVDAQQYQAEAIFHALRSGDKETAELYKSTQAMFVAKQVPDRPWPAQHPLFHPPLLTPTRPAVKPAQAPVQH